MPSYLTSRDLVADKLNQGVAGDTVTNMVRPEYPFNQNQQQPVMNQPQPMMDQQAPQGMKKGGAVKRNKPKCMARGGGCEVRGKTKGRFV